jgi:V/A-type H+-transporting ATPase subunit A
MSRARILWISGPVLRARAEGPFAMREAVAVGPQGLVGEVIRLEGDELVAQVYEDTSGLKPGVEVVGSGGPLAIRLGPGLLGGIFDGLLRPLAGTGSIHVQPGQRRAAARTFDFTPAVSAGMRLEAGAVFGTATAAHGRVQRCLLPPRVSGEVLHVAAAGSHDEDAPLLRLRDAGGRACEIAMGHDWPVRQPRPVRARRPAAKPLVTGQRLLDSLFPVAQGGKAAIPGGFGTGKTVLLETLAKGCDADVIVYLGCGERGNEMAGVLDEFPRLLDPRSGRPLMERTVIIANASNMPVAAREASIYSAVTVAEYFRDQGLHVALMADSTSRWAEALREVSGRFGELPGEGGYPAYLASRLAEFYERAATVETLAGDSGSEPVTSHTRRYVRAFWALDVRRAQARFYPAVNPLQSYAEDTDAFAAWWAAQGNGEWPALRRRFLALLHEQARLERMARIIGKDALPPRQQLVLLCAELVNEAFLRQSALSPVDRSASPARQAAMMRLLGRFLDLAEQALAAGVAPERLAALPVFRALQRMGEDIGEEDIERFAALQAQLEQVLGELIHAGREAPDAAATVD